MLNGILDNFVLPGVAHDALAKMGVRATEIESGVSRFISGHDKGVAYRFFVHTEYNATKSKAARYEVFDTEEMIEWLTDSKCKPTERIRMLPPELLSIDPFTGEAGGRYAESYERFKKGMSAPGTSLGKWGVLSDAEIATLNANNVFSVEQFAAMPRAKIEGKFPQEFKEYFERAVQFVNGKEGRFETDKQAAEIMSLQAEKDKQARMIEELQAQVNALVQGASAPKRGRPRKSEEVEE